MDEGKGKGLSASAQSTILSTIRSVQPGNKSLRLVQVKVPAKSVHEEVLRREEIKKGLDDLRSNKQWFYPCFALWLCTGLRNAEAIGLTWDCVSVVEGINRCTHAIFKKQVRDAFLGFADNTERPNTLRDSNTNPIYKVFALSRYSLSAYFPSSSKPL